MGYDRGDSFPFCFEPNVIPYVSKSKGKLSPRSYPIQCERKWNTSFLSARTLRDFNFVGRLQWGPNPTNKISMSCQRCY